MHWLYQQGGSSTNLYLVQSGLVRLTQVMPEGDEVLVQLVGPGEVFGYSSLVLNCPSSTSAQTVQRTRLMQWERMRALELIQSIPRTTFNLFRIAVRDVVYFNDRARLLQTQSVSHRVEWAVAEVARKAGTKESRSDVIGDGVGQREIADLAGTTIFTVSRELSRLQREGILRKEGRRIFVLQAGKLYH